MNLETFLAIGTPIVGGLTAAIVYLFKLVIADRKDTKEKLAECEKGHRATELRLARVEGKADGYLEAKKDITEMSEAVLDYIAKDGTEEKE